MTLLNFLLISDFPAFAEQMTEYFGNSEQLKQALLYLEDSQPEIWEVCIGGIKVTETSSAYLTDPFEELDYVYATGVPPGAILL
jgi:hypothetical protein